MVKKIFFIFLGAGFLFLSGCNRSGNNNSSATNEVKKFGQKIERTFKRGKLTDTTMYLKNKIISFQRTEGRYPNSLQELVDKGYIKEIPAPPEGMTYYYDPKTGKIEVK